ncbi:uncharacterized protein LOC130054347 [Ostrea edulis]|uniref:uncharacterized protein LOC130054347 n=1 Tax=Ostrea edulis TaxID=37623 RepID=UPI0024AF7B6D|nr:uncharacterized protein LOC130054347 [Ostrea edulis]
MQTLVFLILLRLTLSSGYQIISQKKETAQATEIPECQGSGTCYKSSNAVDGDINTFTRTAPIGTYNQVKSTWWYVDLENILSIYNIRIQFKDYGEQYDRTPVVHSTELQKLLYMQQIRNVISVALKK